VLHVAVGIADGVRVRFGSIEHATVWSAER